MELIDRMIGDDPAAIAAVLHRVRHEVSITANHGGEAIAELRDALRSGATDACLQLSHHDLEWLPKTDDVPTIGETLRIVARRIASRASEVAGTDAKSMARIASKLVGSPLMWLDDGHGLLIRARMAAVISARDTNMQTAPTSS